MTHYQLFVCYLLKMSNKRERSALSSDLGGYWGGQDSAAKKAPKKNNAGGKKTASSTAASVPTVDYAKTELGKSIDGYLSSVFSEVEEHGMCRYASTREHKQEIESILSSNGADVISPLLQPLNKSFMKSIRFFASGRGTFTMMIESGLQNKKGSAIDQMKTFAKWFEEAAYKEIHYYGDEDGRIEGLDWLIGKLDAQKAK